MVYLLGNEVDQWYICVETRLLGKQLRWIYGSVCRYLHQKRNKGTKFNVKVLLGALLFGCNVSSTVHTRL